MKIFDISVDLYNGMPAFPGDPAPVVKRIMEMPRDAANVSAITMGTHTGTHVDPPLHFVEDGLPLDKIPLDHLYGDAEVLDLTYVKKAVSAVDLERANENILLLKTRNSRLWQFTEFHRDYVYLDKSAAQWLIDNHVWTVAIDYLSVGSFEGGETVHKMLLQERDHRSRRREPLRRGAGEVHFRLPAHQDQRRRRRAGARDIDQRIMF